MSLEMSYYWHDHQGAIVRGIQNLWENHYFTDCTLAAEGQYIKAHKLIMSASSPYFQILFSQEQEKNPIVILKDVKFEDLKSIIHFIYCGEVHIPKDHLKAFFSAAENLQIRGLLQTSDKEEDPTLSLEPQNKKTCVSSKLQKVFTTCSSLTISENSSINRLIQSDCEDERVNSPNASVSHLRDILLSPSSQVNSSDQNPSEILKDAYKDSVNSNSVSFLSQVQTCNDNQNSVSKLELGNFMNCVVKSERVEDGTEGETANNMDTYETSFISEIGESETTTDIYDHGSSLTLPVQPIVTLNESSSDNCIDEGEESRNITKSSFFTEYTLKDKLVTSRGISESSYQFNYSASESLPDTSANSPSDRRGTNYPQRDDSSLPQWSSASKLVNAVYPRSQGSGSKRHICSICQKKFPTPFHLKTHIRTHTGEKPFQCHVCSARFSQKSNLNSHLHTHNKGGKLFKCRLCPSVFARNSSVQYHELSVHAEHMQNKLS